MPTIKLINRRPNVRRRVAGACCVLGLWLASASPAWATAWAAWDDAVEPALKLYIDGDYEAAGVVVEQLQRQSRDPRTRREAAIIRALIAVQSADRELVVQARNFLRGQGHEHPDLRQRPEVLLGLGTAALALHETTDALAALEAAATGFDQHDAPDRLATTLTRLIEAWSKHNEWESTPVALPQTPDATREAHQVRVARVRQLLAMLAQLAAANNQQAQLDRGRLVLAKLLREEPSTADAGTALLAALADEPLRSPTVAEARLAAAGAALEEDRGIDAIALLETVAASGRAPYAEQAQRRLDQLNAPQLELTLVNAIQPGASPEIALRTRHVGAVTVEVRALDLRAWLTSVNGQFRSAGLPTAGALRFSRTYDTGESDPYAWWSPASPVTLAAPLAPGAYTVSAVASTAGEELIEKQVLIVSDVLATALLGAERGVIAAHDAAGAPVSGTVTFWMDGSYVPRAVPLVDGVASFALPGEARVFRDKRWVAIVNAADQTALLRGSLPRRPDAASAQVLITTPRPAYAPGEALELFGQLRVAHRLEAVSKPVTIELRDAGDQTIAAREATPTPGGLFSFTFDTADLPAGTHRLVVVQDGQTVPNVLGRQTIHIREREPNPLAVTLAVPSRLPPAEERLLFEITAGYPWGVELPVISGTGGVQAVRLPVPEENTGPEGGPPVRFEFRSNTPTALESFDLLNFELVPGPIGISTGVSVAGLDGRQARARELTLWNETPHYAWIRTSRREAQVGEPITFQLGWFDPTGQVYAREPELKITGPDGVVTLPFHASPTGYRTPPWRPTAPGTYALQSRLVDPARQPFAVTSAITVTPGPPPLTLQDLSVTTEGAEQLVTATVAGPLNRPLLLLLHHDEPIAATLLERDAADARRTVRWRVPRFARPTLSLLALESEGPALVMQSLVSGTGRATSASDADKLQLAAPDSLPPETRRLKLTVTPPAVRDNVDAGSLLVRLVAAGSAGQVLTRAEAERELLRPGAAPLAVNWSTAIRPTDPEWPVPRPQQLTAAPVEAATYEAFYAGETAAVLAGVAAPGEARSVELPLPAEPGNFLALAWYQLPDGRTYTQSAAIEVPGGLHATWHAPAEMMVGDTCRVALVVENHGDEPIDAALEFDASAAVGLQPMRTLPAGAASRFSASAAELTLAPNAPVTLLFTLTGRQAGDGALTATAASGANWSPAAPTVVASVPADQAAADPAITVRRSLWRIAATERERVLLGLGDRGLPNASLPQALPMTDADAFQPGDLVIVRDELTVERPLETVEWRQALPVHLYSITADLPLEGLATTEPAGLHALTATLPRLARTRVHEFAAVAIRPGSMRLPAPRFEQDGRVLESAVVDGPDRVLVRD